MESYVSKQKSCRLCDSEGFILVMPILPSPVADAFVGPDKKDQRKPIPLDLYQCKDCSHVQNLDITNPGLLFRDYNFHTSSSAELVDHFCRYAEDVVKDFKLALNSLVLEISCDEI